MQSTVKSATNLPKFQCGSITVKLMPVVLSGSELKKVSGGSPKGTWSAEASSATVSSPKGTW